jgi:NADPH:quinone reductase-like Zn-dependent oxidoreductase
MRQIWIPKIGEPEVLEVREAPDPEPKAGQVRVRVKASGINFADILARMGLYPDSPKLPAVVGYEVAGVVDGVGDGVERFRDGDRVVCMTALRSSGGGPRHPRQSRFRRRRLDSGQLPDGVVDARLSRACAAR